MQPNSKSKSIFLEQADTYAKTTPLSTISTSRWHDMILKETVHLQKKCFKLRNNLYAHSELKSLNSVSTEHIFFIFAIKEINASSWTTN